MECIDASELAGKAFLIKGMLPEITVLMSVYNEEEYLREAIDSILDQTFLNYEFLIINDGSTDSSRDIILSYADPRITLIDNEENMGLSKSLNRGIKQVKSEFIARQDADDISHPMRLEYEYNFIRKGNYDAVFCRYNYLDKNGKQLSWISPFSTNENLIDVLIALKDPIAHGSVMMKKDSITGAGSYNERFLLSQDYELWLRLLSMGKQISCIDYIGYYQRLRPQLNKTKKRAQRKYTSMVISRYMHGNKFSETELNKIQEMLASSKIQKEDQTVSLLSQISYWFNIHKINIKHYLNLFFASFYKFNSKKRGRISVLMLTGAYHPEVSGAANQCRQLVNRIKEQISFTILTTSRNANLSPQSQVDGIDVTRVLLKKRNYFEQFKAIIKFATFFLSQGKNFQVVHLHGYSLKSTLVVFLSKIFRKKIIIKMTSGGHDDPISMKQRGILINYFFSKADSYVAISPHFEMSYNQSRLPSDCLALIPNGIDKDRFSPVTDGEKAALRNQIGLPKNIKLILFVGHFSKDKCPDVLLKAWMKTIVETVPETGIVFIGSTNPNHFEVDADLVYEIKEIAQPYTNERIFFVENSQEIEKYYQAVDIFVLPSKREGLPNSLLEAMASGLPVIASKIDGITDWVINDGGNGLLFEKGSKDELGNSLLKLLQNKDFSFELGLKARETVLQNFSIEKVANLYLSLYQKLIPSA